MVCGTPSKIYNQEEMFAKNNAAVSQLLLNSQAGKSAKEWKKMILKELTREDIKTRDDQKEKMFKGGNEHIRKTQQLPAN